MNPINKSESPKNLPDKYQVKRSMTSYKLKVKESINWAFLS